MIFISSYISFTRAGISAAQFFIVVFIFIFLFLYLVIGEIYARLSYRFWKYEFTHNELKIEKGIIWKAYKSIPYERVQNVDIHRGILARLLGFSSIQIQTAGYSAVYSGRGLSVGSEGYLPAVSMEGAEKIREFLIKKISKHKSHNGM